VQNLRIIAYHLVAKCPEPLPAGIDLAPEKFAAQMAFLASRGQTVVSLDELMERREVASGDISACCAITFDDGYEDNVTTAYPILQRYDFPSYWFVASDLVDGVWPTEHGVSVPGISSRSLRRLVEEGIVGVGSHGKSHRDFRFLSEEELVSEIDGSRLALEKFTGETPRFLSYPFGSFDERAIALVKRAGYDAGFSVWAPHDDGLYTLDRIPVHRDDPLWLFRLKLSRLYFPVKSFLQRWRLR